MTKRSHAPIVRTSIRCAIYTRKSSEEGLQQEFNSLDAQRESAEAFIAAQKHEGWVCLPDHYDDGGFTGGNMDRPAMQRLMKDIESGKVDCVVVYKVDRLSRSLLDFSRIMSTFDAHNVSFVSVTQQFNTTHSMGRLTLNILLSFAQFEREIISERTRDKIAAARKKGKFSGGRPILGYDAVANPGGSKLIVNDDEAVRVRATFDLYLKHGSLMPVVKELAKRGWTMKRWVGRAGAPIGGGKLNKTALFKMLTSVMYVGKIRHHDKVYTGEHAAIVDEKVWQRVQDMLQRNGRSGGAGSGARNIHGALLKGILRCTACQCAMSHTYSSQRNKRYRYYVCLSAQKNGRSTCPSRSVGAGEMERFVVEQIKAIVAEPGLVAPTLRQAQLQNERELKAHKNESDAAQRELARLSTELSKLAARGPTVEPGALADLHARIDAGERRLSELAEQLRVASESCVSEADVAAALSAFGPAWETLNSHEQARVIRLLVERIDFDGVNGKVSLTLRSPGTKSRVDANKGAAA